MCDVKYIHLYKYSNMGMGSCIITSSAYWGSSDSDDDEYNVSPISNMARKKKQTKVISVKRTLNAWQAFIKSNYEKVRKFPNKERFKKLSQMYKNQ